MKFDMLLYCQSPSIYKYKTVPTMRLSIVITLASLVSLLAPESGHAQQCANFNYDLRSQAAVNSFPSGCDSVGGDVTISGADVSDLSPLTALTSIEGSLIIKDNAALPTLRGLDNLKSITGGLDIHGNSNLANLNGLMDLRRVQGYVYVYGHPVLTSIDGLSMLSSVGSGSAGGSLNVSSNAALRNLNGLTNIRSVGSDIYIDNNPLITTLDGLTNLTSVGRDFNISDNASLYSLRGPDRLSSVGRHLSVNENDALRNLSGLTALHHVGGHFSIYSNDSLGDVNGLLSLGRVEGDFEIFSNNSLANLDGLINLTAVGGHFWIVYNSALRNIDGLTSLDSVQSRPVPIEENYYYGMHVYGNDILLDLDGLTALRTVGGNLSIQRNYSLRNVDGLSNVRSVGNDLYILSNWSLDDCRGVAPLLGWPYGPPYDSVGGSIFIEANDLGCQSVEDIFFTFESEVKITEAYIGLLGRAPDPAGLAYWSGELQSLVASGQNVDIALKKLTNDITLTPEWIGGGGSSGSAYQSAAERVVANMYSNLFSRAATSNDLAYWSVELTSRRVTESEMVVLLIQGAQSKGNADSEVLGFKREAASYYVSKVPQAKFSRSSATGAVSGVYDALTLQASKDATDRL